MRLKKKKWYMQRTQICLNKELKLGILNINTKLTNANVFGL
jgi:hypothetical protein